MKPETRELLYASGQLLRIGIDRALSQLHAEEDKARNGRALDENTWRYYYDLGVKAFHDIAKLAALEMRDEAAEERKAIREAEPVSANEAIRILKDQMNRVLGEDAQPTSEAAKAPSHAPQGPAPVKPAVNTADLRDAWASSSQWLIDARGGQNNPITHKMRKVLASLGINEGEPMETVLRFRDAAAAVLGIPARV
jgi:hypothetical protein